MNSGPLHHDFVDKYIDQPMTDGIVIEKSAVDGEISTNVPHLVAHHSPAGYSVGYGGSGCADLALNICENVLKNEGYTGEIIECWDGSCFGASYAMHQEFKWKFIAPINSDEVIYPYKIIREWVMAKAQEYDTGS